MMRNVHKSLIFAVFLTIQAQSGKQQLELDEILEKFDKLLQKMPQDELLKSLTERQKWKAVQFLGSKFSQSEDPEAHFYEPKKPIELSNEEKKIDVHKRIAKKHIGDLPSHIEDLVSYFNYYDDCVKENVAIHNKLLLHGKPGTGKSHLIKVLSEELQIPLLSFSASFFGDKYIGESSRKIRRVFEVAKRYDRPLLVFIDEIDALATKRKDSTHDEHRATLITLLTELQELHEKKNIFFIVATNDIQALDPAVKDRFAGSVSEIKELDEAQKTKLYQKVFADHGVTIEEEFARRLASITRKDFSNRDVEYIVTTALLKRFLDCKKDAGTCKEGLCSYARKAIDSTGKKGDFYYSVTEAYCDGI